MTGRLVGAISNLSAAGVVVPSLLVVLPVVPSPGLRRGVPCAGGRGSGGGVGPNPLQVHPAIRHWPPGLLNEQLLDSYKRSRRPDRYANADGWLWVGRLELHSAGLRPPRSGRL